MAISMGYKAAFGAAGTKSSKSLRTGSVQGRPSTGSSQKNAVYGKGGGHVGRARPGGGTGGKADKTASYAIPKNKLR